MFVKLNAYTSMNTHTYAHKDAYKHSVTVWIVLFQSGSLGAEVEILKWHSKNIPNATKDKSFLTSMITDNEKWSVSINIECKMSGRKQNVLQFIKNLVYIRRR